MVLAPASDCWEGCLPWYAVSIDDDDDVRRTFFEVGKCVRQREPFPAVRLVGSLEYLGASLAS